MRFEPNRHIVLNYAVRNFRTGQTVNVSVYDEKGTEVLVSTPMTELGSTGIYVKRWTPGKKGTFFAYADCVEYPKKAFQTLVVGGKPGDMKMGGLMPRGIESVWSEEEKSLLMNVVGNLGKKQNVLHENQIEFEKKIVKLSKRKEFDDSEINKRFDNLVNKFNSYSKNSEKNSNLIIKNNIRADGFFSNICDEISKYQTYFQENKKEMKQKFHELNLANDDINVSLKSLGQERDTNISKPFFDEILLNLGVKNGNT